MGSAAVSLHRAASAGRLAAVNELLSAMQSLSTGGGARAASVHISKKMIDARNKRSATPLIVALGSAHGRVALRLAAEGASIDMIPEDMIKEDIGDDMMRMLRASANGELE